MTELAPKPSVTAADAAGKSTLDVNKIAKDSGMDQVSAKAYL